MKRPDVDQLESERYDNLAEFIKANPDSWTTSGDYDYTDDDIVSALKIAADALRRIGK